MTTPEHREEAGVTESVLKLQYEMNEVIERNAWRFGPVTLRPTHAVMGESGIRCVVTDGRGTESMQDMTSSAQMLAARAHSHDKHRLALAHRVNDARRSMAGAFEEMTPGPIDVHLHDHYETGGNMHLAFQVELPLLSSSLEWVPARILHKPHHGDAMRKAVLTQRARFALLGGRPRADVLKCCPVLAASIAASTDIEAWRRRLAKALDDEAAGDQPRFVHGRLVDRVEIAPGVTWRGGRLSIAVRLPETVTMALPGRPLSDVADHPLLPSDAVISTARATGKGTSLTVRATDVRFDVVAARLGCDLEESDLETCNAD